MWTRSYQRTLTKILIMILQTNRRINMTQTKLFSDRLVEVVEKKKANGEKVNPLFERIYNEIKKFKAQEE